MLIMIIIMVMKLIVYNSIVFIHLNHLVSRDTIYYNKYLHSHDSCFVNIIIDR